MLNIREDLKKLLLEAEKVVPAKEKLSDSTEEQAARIREMQARIQAATKKEAEEKKSAEAAAPKKDVVEDSDVAFWRGDNFVSLCRFALDIPECLPLVAQCLRGDFNIGIKTDKGLVRTNPLFDKGLEEVMQFYVDVVDCFNAGEIPGDAEKSKVRKALNAMQLYSEIHGGEVEENRIKSIEKSFTNKDFVFLTEKPTEELEKELTDLCVAGNVVNWERTKTFQNSDKYGSDLMILRDIFKPKRTQSSLVNQSFPSIMSDATLDNFYEDPSNQFATYLKSFAWGKRSHDISDETVIEARVDRVPGDQGAKSGDFDQFILNLLISYLSYILNNNNKVDAGEILKSANLMSINQSKHGVTMGGIISFDTVEALKGTDTVGVGAGALDSQSDLDDPDYRAASSESADDYGAGLLVGGVGGQFAADTRAGEDLYAAEDLRRLLDQLKTGKDWTTENNILFLSNALKTADGADGLSAVLSKVFIALPGTIIRPSYDCPVIQDNKVDTINLLDKIKDLATTSNFIKSLSELVFLLAPSTSATIVRENKLPIRTLLGQLLEASKPLPTLSTEITPGLVQEWIAALPKTLEEAKSAFSVSQSISKSEMGFMLLNASKEAKKVNDIYNKVCSGAPLFQAMSPNEFSPIPPEGLVDGSYLQTQLGINIVPEIAPGIVGITAGQASQGQTKVKTDNLEQVWDIYFTAIKEILEPSNITSWGLLTPTILSYDDPTATVGILYPTSEYPLGSKVGTKTIKPLFDTKDQFTPLRANILSAISERKDKFLSATNLKQIEQLLIEISATFASKKALRFFSSPLTQAIDDRKKGPLYKLLDPKKAFSIYLKNIDQTHAFPLRGGTTTNPFEDLVANILVTNNKSTAEAIIYNKVYSLFEAEEPTKESTTRLELAICNAAINTHIRARILLHLARMVELIQGCFILLRETVVALKTVVTEKLAEDNIGASEKLFSDLAEIIANILPEREKSSLDGIRAKIATGVLKINAPQEKAESARQATSKLKDAASLDVTYGGGD